jgi:hydroxyacylglutathione hydrolase
MRIVPVACLADNYAYLVVCERTGRAAVVDPSEAEPVLAAVAREGVELAAVWCTHHHYDHTDGNLGLKMARPGLPVYAHDSDRGRVPGQTAGLAEGDCVEVDDVVARIVHNPGHTTGAVSYVVGERAVFTGDTLFGAGCGRIFEGTPPMMHASLHKLAELPDLIEVYCGHEYTVNNLRFAAQVEPQSAQVAARAERVAALRAAGRPSVPSTMAEERATNPFLRSAVPAVAESARRHEPGAADEIEVFAALRRWKDKFR